MNAHTGREPEVMHLLRCLAFLEARFSFHIFATHIRGTHSVLADALSWNNEVLFRALFPQAHREPTPIPASLLDVLVVTKPDWTSQHWTQLWSTFQTWVSDSTQRSYTAAKRRYVQFCKLDSLPPLPTSEHLLCQYVAYLAVSGLAYSTIKSYLSAVCHLHIAENWGNPGISSMPRLEQVLLGIYASEGQ